MANVAIIKGGEQIFVDHVRASAKIDKRRSLRQQSQHLPIDEVLGGGGAREQADQDITVGKKRREPRSPVETRDSRQRLRRSAPARAPEAEMSKFLERAGSEIAKTHHPNTAFDGVNWMKITPLGGTLCFGELGDASVQGERMEYGVLSDTPSQALIDQADDRNVGWQLWVREDKVHSGAKVDDNFQLRKLAQYTMGMLPDERSDDILLSANIGPDARLDLWEIFRELSLPSSRVTVLADEN